MKRFLMCLGLIAATAVSLSAQMTSGKRHHAPLSPPAKAMATI